MRETMAGAMKRTMGASLLGLLVFSCGDAVETPQVGPIGASKVGLKSTSLAALMTAPEAELEQDLYVNGSRWVHVRKVEQFAEAGEYENNEAERIRRLQSGEVEADHQGAGKTHEERRAELAEAYRGVSLFRGHEYRQSEPAWAIADAILAQERQPVDDRKPVAAPLPDEPPVEDNVGQAVQGNDTRSLIRSNTSYPFRAQSRNIHWQESGGGRVTLSACSGTMIGPSTMLTAAHCLHSGTSWYPGNWQEAMGVDHQDGWPAGHPYGVIDCVWGTLPGAWTSNNTSVTNDYAVFEFSGCGLYPGNTVGWLGLWAANDASLHQQSMNVYGYPGDSEGCLGGTCFWPSIWGTADSTNAGEDGSTAIQYDTDATGGQSGAGVYLFSGNSRYIVGIHKGENWELTNGWYNFGRRVTTSLLSFIESNSDWTRSNQFPGGYASQ